MKPTTSSQVSEWLDLVKAHLDLVEMNNGVLLRHAQLSGDPTVLSASQRLSSELNAIKVMVNDYQKGLPQILASTRSTHTDDLVQ